MKREKVKEVRSLTESAEINGRLILFSYEQSEDKKIESCGFAVFEEKNTANTSYSAIINKSKGFVSITLHKEMEAGDLLVIGEAIKEVENILTLKEAKVEEVAEELEEKVVVDEASASK